MVPNRSNQTWLKRSLYSTITRVVVVARPSHSKRLCGLNGDGRIDQVCMRICLDEDERKKPWTITGEWADDEQRVAREFQRLTCIRGQEWQVQSESWFVQPREHLFHELGVAMLERLQTVDARDRNDESRGNRKQGSPQVGSGGWIVMEGISDRRKWAQSK